ncbi:MAG: 50S ribosomal protein L11 methyltransferase [Proteobacteria bacterium]|nr:50S ribosomal protein L11 methyltransferase [Pseudomonadota bacterium]
MTMEAHGQAVHQLTPEACGRRWIIELTADMETLWEAIGEDDFGDDERLPYWAALWPSSLALADWLGEHAERIRGRICLDMGCGLGLTAIVGASLGARVAAFDYELAPLTFAVGNAEANAVPQPLWLQMDWREPAVRPGCAEVIWGGDIVYETRFIEPVGRFLDVALAPGGVAWIAEPGRNIGPPFIRWMREHGFSCERTLTRNFPYEGHPVTVHILEIQRDA